MHLQNAPGYTTESPHVNISSIESSTSLLKILKVRLQNMLLKTQHLKRYQPKHF